MGSRSLVGPQDFEIVLQAVKDAAAKRLAALLDLRPTLPTPCGLEFLEDLFSYLSAHLRSAVETLNENEPRGLGALIMERAQRLDLECHAAVDCGQEDDQRCSVEQERMSNDPEVFHREGPD